MPVVSSFACFYLSILIYPSSHLSLLTCVPFPFPFPFFDKLLFIYFPGHFFYYRLLGYFFSFSLLLPSFRGVADTPLRTIIWAARLSQPHVHQPDSQYLSALDSRATNQSSAQPRHSSVNAANTLLALLLLSPRCIQLTTGKGSIHETLYKWCSYSNLSSHKPQQ